MDLARIPKVIHYCWFGGNPLPPLALKCIESWRKYFPEWEIKEWNESNFDVRAIPYVAEAYDAGKYAFVSDYARFKILYDEGGVYFDTDVEVIAHMDDIIERGNFMGCEKNAGAKSVAKQINVNPGLGMGAVKELDFYREMLSHYEASHFRMDDGSLNKITVVEYTTGKLRDRGLENIDGIQLVADIWIYPEEYFCPVDFRIGECVSTPNTRSIHHYAASWLTPCDKRMQKWKRRLSYLPDWLGYKVARLLAVMKF